MLRCQLCEAFYWLMPRLPRFHEKHPEVQLQIISALGPITEATEPFDIALQTTGRASGSARLLFTAADMIFPVCAPSFLVNHPAPLTQEALRELPLLSHRVTPQDWFDWPDWFEAVGLSRPARLPRVSFDSYPLVLQAAIAGQGIALGWSRTVSGLIEDGKLQPASDLSIERHHEISVFRIARHANHHAVDCLVTWLKSELTALSEEY